MALLGIQETKPPSCPTKEPVELLPTPCAMVSRSKYGNISKTFFFTAEGSFDRVADVLCIPVQGSEA